MSEDGPPRERDPTDAPMRVLLVDDEREVADLTARFLDRSDHPLTVSVAYDAEAGLDRLEQGDPGFDCVVSDYRMPGTDGIAFLRTVRERYPELPFLLFTGEGSEDLASEAISAGVTDYLRKGSGTDQYDVLAQQVANAVRRRRAERRADRQFEAAPDVIVVVDGAGGIRRANDRVTDLFDRDPDALLGAPFAELFPERFHDRVASLRADCVGSPGRCPIDAEGDLQGLRADGTEFPVELGLSPVGDGRGEVIATIRDVTARRRREAEIAELNHINRTLRETTGAVVRAESREEIQQVLCDRLAESEPYLFAWVGRVEDNEVVPVAWAGVERGYLDEITVTADRSPTGRGPGGRAARTREPQAMQDIHTDPAFEPWREQAVERGYRSVASIPLSYQDTLYGVLNVYADRAGAFDERELTVLDELGKSVAHAISRVELTEELREQYRDLFEEAPAMAVRTRNEGGEPIVEACNRRFLEALGYEREAVVGEPLAAFYTERSTRDLLDEGGYARALADEFTREERELVTADGEVVTTLLRAVPRRDGTGAVIGSLAIYVDITERRQLERENERLDAFTSIVSHDLRNPLNVLQGHAALAGEECDSHHVAKIEAAADRMERLIDDLLMLARQGETVSETRPIGIGAVAERAWRNVETPDATLDAAASRSITADPERLTQLLENLYRNAVEHAGAGVTVTVGLLDGPDGPGGFFVADDGPGIPEGEQAAVFDQGYSTKPSGTGFGLTIVERIAEAHGWTVSATESASGGARFEFTGVEPA